MAPIAKDVETPTRTTSAVPSPGPTAQAAATRPQPVPLEVPVSVNGARTIEGSDKREPFSESTKTVLVFANGAVIRLASSVSPGQLLFVTNEKSKKEVVCQVVKSKNYRTVTGYVELEFTEPAAGFWGVRIPTESAVSPATAVKAPAVARPGAPEVSPAAAPPKPLAATPVVPVATVSTKPNLPVAAPANKPAVVRPTSPAVPPLPAKPESNKNALPAKDPQPPKPEIKLPTIAEFLAASPVGPPQPPAVNGEPLPAQQPSTSAPSVTAPAAELKLPMASLPAPTVTNPPAKTKDATTDELRQQAARLQEQLSSLLFREEVLEKGTARPVVATPGEPIRELATTPKPAAEIPVSAPLVSPTEISTEVAIAVKPLLAASPAGETKPSAAKPAPFNLKVEEVKIPSWLAPLARETDAQSSSPSPSEISENIGIENNARVDSGDYSSQGAEEKSAASEAVVFGGQLLGGATATDERVSSPGSKKGLILGLAAAVAIVIGGGVWYGFEPGNFLAGNRAARTIPASNFPEPGPATASPTAPGSALTGSVAPVVASPSPALTQPAKTPVAEGNKTSSAPVNSETRSGNSVVGTEPPLEQQKKPVLGEVHLATPNVNHGENSAPSEAAPSIDSTDAAATGDQLGAIATGNGSQPAVPLPVGGEVKPAELRKSVPPIYPPTAKSQRVAGDVKLDALIDADGNVTATRVLSGPVLLHQAAAAAVKQWKYQPAVLDGKPTAMHLTVTVQFRLD
ncbi:MAG TPA: TonB family protein [Candidatus Acidoferrum sp.]|nr:TonB family protein [Candidatus Acidoferrum sp.]